LREIASLIKVATRGGIAQARERLGSEPVEKLHDELVVPIALKGKKQTTKGAWYREWLKVSIDGSTLDVTDTKANEEAFGRPGAGRAATPRNVSRPGCVPGIPRAAVAGLAHANGPAGRADRAPCGRRFRAVPPHPRFLRRAVRLAGLTWHSI